MYENSFCSIIPFYLRETDDNVTGIWTKQKNSTFHGNRGTYLCNNTVYELHHWSKVQYNIIIDHDEYMKIMYKIWFLSESVLRDGHIIIFCIISCRFMGLKQSNYHFEFKYIAIWWTRPIMEARAWTLNMDVYNNTMQFLHVYYNMMYSSSYIQTYKPNSNYNLHQGSTVQYHNNYINHNRSICKIYKTGLQSKILYAMYASFAYLGIDTVQL